MYRSLDQAAHDTRLKLKLSSCNDLRNQLQRVALKVFLRFTVTNLFRLYEKIKFSVLCEVCHTRVIETETAAEIPTCYLKILESKKPSR